MDEILEKWKAEVMNYRVKEDDWKNASFKVQIELTRVDEEKLCV